MSYMSCYNSLYFCYSNCLVFLFLVEKFFWIVRTFLEMHENLQRRNNAAQASTQQTTESLENGMPSVGSLVSRSFYDSQQNEINTIDNVVLPKTRFGQQVELVLNKLSIFMLTLIIYDLTLM